MPAPEKTGGDHLDSGQIFGFQYPMAWKHPDYEPPLTKADWIIGSILMVGLVAILFVVFR